MWRFEHMNTDVDGNGNLFQFELTRSSEFSEDKFVLYLILKEIDLWFIFQSVLLFDDQNLSKFQIFKCQKTRNCFVVHFPVCSLFWWSNNRNSKISKFENLKKMSKFKKTLKTLKILQQFSRISHFVIISYHEQRKKSFFVAFQKLQRRRSKFMAFNIVVHIVKWQAQDH